MGGHDAAGAPSRDGAGSDGLLSNVTVLDLTQHLAGPFATQILGDLGARIVKVEPPGGDPTRHIGPYFHEGTSAYFHSVNRNKQSVCIDLKAPGGTEALMALVAKADVVIENFRPGTLDKLGIGYDTLLTVNPRIVLCSISGFGQSGPYREQPAFDIIVQALSGGMSLTGEEGGRPVRSGLPIGDMCAGMYGAIGVLAALQRALVEGKPSYIDVSMFDTQVAMLSYVAAYYLIGGHVAGLQGRGHMSIPTYRGWTCSDGRDVVTAANTERQWVALCEVLGLPGLLEDPRFANNNLRREHKADLYDVLEPAMARLTSTEALDRLRQAGVPVAPINTIDRVLVDPQVLHREMVVDVGRNGSECKVVGTPVKVVGGPALAEPPPLLGEHTHTVLAELADLAPALLRQYFASGALSSAQPDPDSLHSPEAEAAAKAVE